MSVMLKKLQQKYARIKDEMVRWDEFQSQLLSQFGNASSIINRLQMLTEDENYGPLIVLPGIKDALLGKQIGSLEMIFISLKDTVKEFHRVVLSLDKIARDGEQLVSGSTQYQMQLHVGIQPSLQQCLDGLNTFHKMYKSEFLLKSSILSSFMLNYLKYSADDIAIYRLLLVDQPNISKYDVQTIFDIVLPEVADDGLTGLETRSFHKIIEKMTAGCIGKCLMFSIRSSWRSIHQHPFVAALLLFMLFLHVYLPSIFAFIVNSSLVIACTSLLLGALLVDGEPDDIHEPENVKNLDISVNVAEKEERSRDVDVLKKGERYISVENVKNRRPLSVAVDGPFKRIHDGEGKDGLDLVASSSSKIAEKEVQTEETRYSHVAEPGLSGKGVEGAVDGQIADPVFDSCPSAKSTYHIPSLETLFSKVKGKEDVSTRSSLESETQANLQEVLLTPMVFEQGTALEEEDFNPPVPQDFIDGVGIDQENVVEKVIGLHEVSDEVHANLREIESVHERSDLGINLTENLRMENLMPDGENQELQPKPVKQLDSKKVDSFSEKEDIQFQYPVLISDDAGISVNQQSNLNNSHDKHSAMEQHAALKLNAGSSIIPLDGDVEIKNAKLNLHIPQPSVLDTVLPGQQSSLETVASSTSESTFDNSRNSPKSLSSKDKLEPSEYELNKNQPESA